MKGDYMDPSITDVKSLFTTGDLSDETSSLMINSLDGTNLVGCSGAAADDMETDDVTVVSAILDDSASMHQFRDVVRESYDKFIKSLKDSKQSGSMLVSTRVFATRQKILHGFKKVDDIAPIGNDYKANGSSTALYDTLMEAMAGIKAYSKDLNQNGVRTKCIVVVFSDGDDNDSRKVKSFQVKAVSEELLKSEKVYLVYGGYQQDPNANLKAIADEVGFPSVMITNASEHDIRQTMDLVSKSIIRTSQTQVGKSNSFFQN